MAGKAPICGGDGFWHGGFQPTCFDWYFSLEVL
jgi:hypothetical protein